MEKEKMAKALGEVELGEHEEISLDTLEEMTGGFAEQPEEEVSCNE